LYVGVLSLGVNLLMLTAPLYMMQLFDRVLTSRSGETLVALLIIAFGALATLALLDAARGMVLVRVGRWLDNALAGTVFSAALKPAGAQQTSSAQPLRDLSTIRGFVGSTALFPLFDAPWAPIFLIILFLLHPLLGVLATVGALVLLAVAIGGEVLTRKTLGQADDVQIRAQSMVETAGRNSEAISAMGMLGAIYRRWQPANEEALRMQSVAADHASILAAASKFIRLALQIAVLSLGAWLVLSDSLTAGGMIAASILMGRALAPVDQAIGTWKNGIAARDAYRRLDAALRDVPAAEERLPLPAPTGKIDVSAVGFIYPGHDEPSLNAVSFKIDPGTVLGVVGPTGSGKTTLARMLMGNLVPKVGHVRLDGMEVSGWDNADLGKHIGYLPQDVQLFEGTVAENIARMETPNAEKVAAAAQLAGAHDMILALPRGYDYVIGAEGAGLSGGQRQAIGLARALYGDPKLIVLDEPTASADRRGDVHLAEALSVLKERGVTCVLVTHRPSALEPADAILVLNAGQVARFGPSAEVLAEMQPSSWTPKPSLVKGATS
jgi:PrtD family type I secretion system ABC transporter